jgi:hypothetical protein
MVRTVGKPQRRPWLRRYLTEVREGLIQDLAAREEDLSMAQRVIIDRVVTLLGLVRLYEENVRVKGLFAEGNPLSELQTLYLTYNETIRRHLQALGISKRRVDGGLMPWELDDDKNDHPGTA